MIHSIITSRGIAAIRLFGIAAVFSVVSGKHISAFEFTGERWHDQISYHYMVGCPAYVMPAIEKAFATVSPVAFKNTGIRHAVGFDYKVTLYCAAEPFSSLQVVPPEIQSEETNFSTEEQTIGATTRRYWLKSTKEIVDFDIWLNSAVITPQNIHKILNHEILHGLGIRHSENPDALMYYLPLREDLHVDDLAAVSLLYEICEDQIDEELNLFMHKVPVNGELYYGILPNGGRWPDDVHTIGYSVC